MSLHFALHASVVHSDESAVDRLRNISNGSDEKIITSKGFNVDVDSVRLTMFHDRVSTVPAFALVFVPPTFIDSSIDRDRDQERKERRPMILEPAERKRVSSTLLPMVHPFLAQNLSIKGLITNFNKHHAPSDIVLLDLSHSPQAAVEDLMGHIQGQTLHSGTDCALQVIPIQSVEFTSSGRNTPSTIGMFPPQIDIPYCPVCLHRIDPVRLGRPPLTSNSLNRCSRFCPPPSLTTIPLVAGGVPNNCCPRQRQLQPWPYPSNCSACRVIRQYWWRDESHRGSGGEEQDLFCFSCSLRETLWVCLTCAFVGCGRYSNKHMEQHYRDSFHPFCLELSTLRIWDYVNGDFTHRTDFLECPSSPPLLQPWIPAASNRESFMPMEYHSRNGGMEVIGSPMWGDMVEKSPKKATMIGEEYEALLQSALEEQAQHYEGEISRLRAELTGARVCQESVSDKDRGMIEGLQSAIAEYQSEIEKAGRELVELQSQEVGYRAHSQRLLREQQVVQEDLRKIQEEAKAEDKEGRMQVEELEQQIADLTANQKMRNQFSVDKELANSQIFGTASGRKGRKPKRSSRRIP